MPLDTLITGRIATLAGDSGFGWVEALGIGGRHIAFAGSAIELETRADPHTRRIELGPGEIAVPGLTDAHLHVAEAAIEATLLDLEDAATLEEGLARVTARHAALPDPEAWLVGQGWDSDRWAGWPTAKALEGAAPGRRVALWAHDRHALWASSTALRSTGVDRFEGNPPGGIVRRDAAGTPSGILHETAARLVANEIPAPSAEEIAAAIPALVRRLLAAGVTGVHDPAQLSADTDLSRAFAAYRRLDERGDLALRIHAGIREESLGVAAERGLRTGSALSDADPSRVTFGWLKLFADGTVGSRTAALLEPLEPEPDRPVEADQERGVWFTDPAELAALAARATGQGITTMIHAIGDAAVRAALDALEPTVGKTPYMPRLEHIQLATPEDRARFGPLGIAASVQPVHLRSDAAAARKTWGARAEANGYPLRSLLDAGAVVAFGTDAPVEPVDPWPGIAIAILRHDASWPEGIERFGPQEALTLSEALRCATLAPATTTREPDRGRLTPGSLADLTILPAAPRDAIETARDGIVEVRPRLTMLDGEVVFQA
ncbi:MAG: amidohydrolase [Chloroflexi bacterium]|nr:amidohydrolase [Chloroflexota bacterium]